MLLLLFCLSCSLVAQMNAFYMLMLTGLVAIYVYMFYMVLWKVEHIEIKWEFSGYKWFSL